MYICSVCGKPADHKVCDDCMAEMSVENGERAALARERRDIYLERKVVAKHVSKNRRAERACKEVVRGGGW